MYNNDIYRRSCCSSRVARRAGGPASASTGAGPVFGFFRAATLGRRLGLRTLDLSTLLDRSLVWRIV